MYHDPRLIQYARELRHDLAPAERILWQQLRGRRFAGYRFRRQHLIDPYIADFYCAAASLVVELDGETHLGADREEADRRRQRFLEDNGLCVLRFWNTDVFESLDAVMEVIYRECVARARFPAKPPLTPDPSPQRGEGGKRRPLTS
jgi:adenine-specific DNA-methyltransferase